MYVYHQTETDLWTTGHYRPNDNEWVPECDFSTEEEAAARCHWLNGGNTPWNMMLEIMEDAQRGEGEPDEDEEGEEWKGGIISIDEEDVEVIDDDLRTRHVRQARAIKTERIEFENVVYYSQNVTGEVLSAEIKMDVGGCAPEMFVVLRSMDHRCQHMQAKKLEGKKVRVTVEVIE